MEQIKVKTGRNTRVRFVEFKLNDDTNFFAGTSQTIENTIEQELINFFDTATGGSEGRKTYLHGLANQKSGDNGKMLAGFYAKYVIPIRISRGDKAKKIPTKKPIAEELIKLYDELKGELSEKRDELYEEEEGYQEEEEEYFNESEDYEF